MSIYNVSINYYTNYGKITINLYTLVYIDKIDTMQKIKRFV